MVAVIACVAGLKPGSLLLSWIALGAPVGSIVVDVIDPLALASATRALPTYRNPAGSLMSMFTLAFSPLGIST